MILSSIHFFREKWERINVSWTEDGEEVSFGTKKTYFFRADLSVGSEDDLMMLPNIPMIVSKLIIIIRRRKILEQYLRKLFIFLYRVHYVQ